MKKIAFIVFLLTLAVGSILSAKSGFGSFKINFGAVNGSGSPQTEVRNLSGFREIKVNGAANIEISAQKEFGVEVEADDNLLEHIKTEISGDTLKIYSEGRISPKTRISIKVSMPEIDSLMVNGASNVVVSNVKSDSMKLKVNGASKVKIDGEVNILKTEANGASGINAEDLKVENAYVEANGASKTTVWVNNELKADASGASTIYYMGEPKDVASKSSGASSVKRK